MADAFFSSPLWELLQKMGQCKCCLTPQVLFVQFHIQSPCLGESWVHADPTPLTAAHPLVSMRRNLSEWGGRSRALLRLSVRSG